MKRKLILFIGILLLLGCGNTTAVQPDRLIDEETMSKIIYDLAVLEALKSRQPQLNSQSTAEYVYKKYNIDSVQFAQNNRFYASQIEKYQKIYAVVSGRMESEKKVADSLVKVNNEVPAASAQGSEAPQIK